jgi:hypothetical protein
MPGSATVTGRRALLKLLPPVFHPGASGVQLSLSLAAVVGWVGVDL